MPSTAHGERPELLRVALPLRLKPLPPGTPLPGDWGQPPYGISAHGFLFHLIDEVAPAVAAAMHGRGDGRREFALSPLLVDPRGPMASRIEPGARYWLRLALLSPALVQLWPEHLLAALRRRSFFHLGPGEPHHPAAQPCAWDYVLALTGDAPLAEATTFSGLLTAPAAPCWRLAFQTPAVFRPATPPEERALAPRLHLPLPVPELLLQNLGRAWVSWSPPPLADLGDWEAVSALSRHVQLDAVAGESVPLPPPFGIAVGFLGTATLTHYAGRQTAGDRARALRQLSALLGLARFTGVGVKTAMGLGIVDAVPVQGGAPRHRRLK